MYRLKEPWRAERLFRTGGHKESIGEKYGSRKHQRTEAEGKGKAFAFTKSRVLGENVHFIKKCLCSDEAYQDYEPVIVLSCLQGIMGNIYADDAENPGTAAAVIGDFTVFAGKASREAVVLAPAEAEKRYRILVPQSAAWEAQIEEIYGSNAEKITRYAMKRKGPSFDKHKLKEIFSAVSGECEIKRITREIYEKCIGQAWSRDLVANYGGFEAYEKLGTGFVILKNGEIISGASSYTTCRGCIEIEIDTKHGFRRKGFAGVCAARLIYECIENGIYPDWDAHNEASANLAEKLGYEKRRSYTAYEIY